MQRRITNAGLWIAGAAIASVGVGSALWQTHAVHIEHEAALKRIAAINSQPVLQGWHYSNSERQLVERTATSAAPGFSTFDIDAFCQGVDRTSRLGVACTDVRQPLAKE